jgi:hypothetical protein
VPALPAVRKRPLIRDLLAETSGLSHLVGADVRAIENRTPAAFADCFLHARNVGVFIAQPVRWQCIIRRGDNRLVDAILRAVSHYQLIQGFQPQ